MSEENLKVCQNCKREIPGENFVIHQVHCARNIRLCPVCKEPVPQNELADHHEKLHKLLPCKQCGESVCGTDLEDHIRDSCALTNKSCRFCELEVPRRELPAHEGYCGVRTEQCSDCREWVMIKYRQLHLDSNHGFLRLDDDPAPTNTKLRLPTSSNGEASLLPKRNNPIPKNINLLQNAPKTTMRYFNDTSLAAGPSNIGTPAQSNVIDAAASTSRAPSSVNGAMPRAPLKRTNDQPQINTAVADTNKVDKNLSESRGAVKKRPAPKPPVKALPPPDPMRDLPYYSALQRHQQEEKKREAQNTYNASVGLPPVLSPAAKVEKLRKMDALHNREVEDKDYKTRLQGRVWQSSDISPGYRVGSSQTAAERPEPCKEDFRNLKPMTPQQFMNRFRELQLMTDGRNAPVEEIQPGRSEEGAAGDRIGEIKSSLSQLRRGLNQIIYSYDNNSNATGEALDNRPNSPQLVAGDDMDVTLPCEFCGAPIPAQDLVQHQTGCRPDLVQYRPRRSSSPPSPPQRVRSPAPRVRSPAPRVPSLVPRGPSPSAVDDIPVIPCEFCAESLPVYLITEHQERCGRENNLLYPD